MKLVEQTRNQLRPVERTLRAARESGQKALRRADALDPRSWKQLSGAPLAEEGRQSPMRPLQAKAAQGAHGCLQRRGLLGAGGGVAGRKQPVEFLLGKRTVKPAQQKVRRARQRNLAER